ncbi:hypothetical protein B0H19DRAFT_1151920 [Mycena capillaripes]|nr:hypothetical protein B0H19DRAFT_1151920 [Mycena capillaripes]
MPGIYCQKPNNCSDPEDIRRYIKDFRLHTERIQETSPVQFPTKLDFRKGHADWFSEYVLRGHSPRKIFDLDSMPVHTNRTFNIDTGSSVTLASNAAVFGDAVRTPLEIFPPLSGSGLDEFPFEFGTPGLPRAPVTRSASPSTPETLSMLPTFSLLDPFIGLDNALGDPTLKMLYHLELGPGFPLRPFVDDDLEPIHVCGSLLGVRIQSTVLHQMWAALKRLANVIHCAANKHFPQRGRTPFSIPVHALEELGATMPGISIFMGYDPSRMDDSPLFLTREAAVEYLTKGAKIWTYFMHWLACAMIHSHENGFNSRLNFGAPIRMQDTEFFHRVSQYAFYGSAQSLRRLMSHTVYANSMDFSMFIDGCACIHTHAFQCVPSLFPSLRDASFSRRITATSTCASGRCQRRILDIVRFVETKWQSCTCACISMHEGFPSLTWMPRSSLPRKATLPFTTSWCRLRDHRRTRYLPLVTLYLLPMNCNIKCYLFSNFE